MTPVSRRTLLGAGLSGLALAAVPARAATPAARQGAALLALARAGLVANAAHLPLADRVAIADFSLPSRLPRFFLVSPGGGEARALLCAHGRGSDPTHSGMLQHFSNSDGSFATSEGTYLTRETYEGKHGASMRLVGLDPSNDRAEARAIVIHGADYVTEAMAERMGKIGRSQGCFAFTREALPSVIAALGPGRLLLAGRFGIA
jgi:hypothetical protein